MKRFPGKIIMAAIILSCGFVMQAEQSAQGNKSKQFYNGAATRDVAFNSHAPAKDAKGVGARASW